jgi:hypothetical protein
LNVWRELALASVMVMEVSWGTAWLRALAPDVRLANPLSTYLACWAVVYGAHLLARLGNALRLKNALRRGLLLIFLMLSFILVARVTLAGGDAATLDAFLNRPLSDISEIGALLPAEVFLAVMVLLLVQRGASLARAWGGRETVFTSLQWGLGLFAAYGVYATLTRLATPGWLLYAFVAGALLAMVAGRVAALVWMRGGVRSPFDARWLGGILAAVTAAGLAACSAACWAGRPSAQPTRAPAVLRHRGADGCSNCLFTEDQQSRSKQPAVTPTPTPAPLGPRMEQAAAQPTALPGWLTWPMRATACWRTCSRFCWRLSSWRCWRSSFAR